MMSIFAFLNISSLFYKDTFIYTRLFIFYLSVILSHCCSSVVSGKCASINGQHWKGKGVVLKFAHHLFCYARRSHCISVLCLQVANKKSVNLQDR